MRRWLTIVVAILGVAVLVMTVTAVIGNPITSDIAPEQDPSPDLVELETGQDLWPYYSSRVGTFELRSAINVVIAGSIEEVIPLLADDADWVETDPDEEGDAGSESFSLLEIAEADGENPLGWGRAVGTQRFAYMEVDGVGHWLEESEQLHDGDYYGSRYHLRLYEAPGGEELVAIQAHEEHFDWFTLRHTVTSVETAQSRLEADLMEALGPEHVVRVYMFNDDIYDSDGWVTFAGVAMLPVVLLLGSMGAVRSTIARNDPYDVIDRTSERLSMVHMALFFAMLVIILGVRLLGIALERGDAFPIKWIAAGLFPLIALGLPVIAYVLATQLTRRMDAAMAASTGLGMAVILDYLFVGVITIPIELLLHRTGLVVAVGLIAAGGAARATEQSRFNEFVLIGVLLWVVMLVLSLATII